MFRTKCTEHDHSDFFRFLQMDRTRQDCYFYYYSKCTKENCPYRHEPSALGCETTCTYWQQGTCGNDKCNFRHMELKKNRKAIQCYWEMQPSGCTKPHCSFMHRNPRPGANNAAPATKALTTELMPQNQANQDWALRNDDSKFNSSGTDSDQGRGSSEAGSFIGSPSVDPVISNFEEGMRLY